MAENIKTYSDEQLNVLLESIQQEIKERKEPPLKPGDVYEITGSNKIKILICKSSSGLGAVCLTVYPGEAWTDLNREDQNALKVATVNSWKPYKYLGKIEDLLR